MRSLSHRLAALVLVVLVPAGCASTSTLTIPRCAERVEVDGESQRQGDTLIFDHGLDAPWTFTEIVVNDAGDRRVVRVGNTSPHGGRLISGIVIGAVSGAVAVTSLADMSDGRVADYGPIYGAIFGSIGTAFGVFLTLTGWGPGRTVDVESRVCGAP